MSNTQASTSHPPVVAPGPLGLLDTTVGLKLLMAVSGALLVGFIVMHFLGNALVFAGPEALNAYSDLLQHSHGLIWVARAVLLLSVVVHILAAVRLYARNAAARPARYRVKRDAATNYAARTMVASGPILLGFLLFHLSHLTFGVAPGAYAHSATDVYANVVNSFRIPWVSGLYIVSMLALGNHLFHGTWSMLQTLGLNHSAYNQRLMRVALGLTLLVTIGNICIPLAVLLRIVG